MKKTIVISFLCTTADILARKMVDWINSINRENTAVKSTSMLYDAQQSSYRGFIFAETSDRKLVSSEACVIEA